MLLYIVCQGTRYSCQGTRVPCQDLYQIDLVDGGVVVVCNLFNEGSEMEDNIEKHFEDIHNKILGPNKWTLCLDRGWVSAMNVG